MNVSDLGEFELIARLTKNLPLRTDVSLGAGDDCAILDLGGNLLLLATNDSQVEGVHFTFQTSTPEQIGRKALAVNISDIAAMGGEPRYALISLILPSHLSLDMLERIYTGLHQEAEQFAIAIVGGNIAGAGKGEQLIIDITLLGTVERGHALLRSGAHIGDTIYVTGFLGDSAAGLYTLLHPNSLYPQDAQEHLRTIHRVPHPHVRTGQMLSQLGPNIVTAMLDISDGLSGDLAHLCERSKVGACINVASLPLSPALRALAASVGHDPLDWALHGGEDYELLFTVSPRNENAVIEAIQAATDTPMTAIGCICQEDMKLVYPDGHEEVLQQQSWDHLRQI